MKGGLERGGGVDERPISPTLLRRESNIFDDKRNLSDFAKSQYLISPTFDMAGGLAIGLVDMVIVLGLQIRLWYGMRYDMGTYELKGSLAWALPPLRLTKDPSQLGLRRHLNYGLTQINRLTKCDQIKLLSVQLDKNEKADIFFVTENAEVLVIWRLLRRLQLHTLVNFAKALPYLA